MSVISLSIYHPNNLPSKRKKTCVYILLRWEFWLNLFYRSLQEPKGICWTMSHSIFKVSTKANKSNCIYPFSQLSCRRNFSDSWVLNVITGTVVLSTPSGQLFHVWSEDNITSRSTDPVIHSSAVSAIQDLVWLIMSTSDSNRRFDGPLCWIWWSWLLFGSTSDRCGQCFGWSLVFEFVYVSRKYTTFVAAIDVTVEFWPIELDFVVKWDNLLEEFSNQIVFIIIFTNPFTEFTLHKSQICGI